MIFQHTIDKVLNGEKTQTRRIVKPNHIVGRIPPNTPLEFMSVGQSWGDIVAVRSNVSYTDIYAIGKTYAVQRGRGVKAEGRIRIIDIRREDVRNISETDALAEGFSGHLDFLYTWIGMHDKGYLETFRYAVDMGRLYEHGFRERPAARYDAWVIEFMLVNAASRDDAQGETAAGGGAR
mgnify:CR=1 FL=1